MTGHFHRMHARGSAPQDGPDTDSNKDDHNLVNAKFAKAAKAPHDGIPVLAYQAVDSPSDIDDVDGPSSARVQHSTAPSSTARYPCGHGEQSLHGTADPER